VLEFFAARIRNGHTRRAYGHAVKCFLGFCAARGARRLQDVDPVAVAAYIEAHSGSEPTRKLHLSGIRHFFDWLVTGQVVAVNPALSVRGPRHVVTEGVTPAFDVEQARALLRSIEGTDSVSRRDRAIIGCLIYTAARAGAVARLRVRDFAPEGVQRVLKFREKGGKARKIPVRHDLEELLWEYPDGIGARDEDKTPLFRTADRRTKRLTANAMTGKDVLRMVKRRLRAAGLPETFSCHSFRATTITNLLEQGVPLEDVQYLANIVERISI
jgi:site-specific recombinase XerD